VAAFRNLFTFLLIVILSSFLASGCRQSEAPAPPALVDEPAAPVTVTETWQEFVDRYIEESLRAHPAWAVVQGRHEFDGQLPDWSKAGIEAEIARWHAARDTAMAFAAEDLDAQQRYQREYLVSVIDENLFWNEKARWPFRNPQHYFGWLSDSLDPAPYLTLNYAPVEKRMQAFIQYLAAIPLALEQIRDNLEMPMPRPWVQLGIDSFGGYAAYFRDDVPAIWAGVDDPALQAAFAQANPKAIEAMEEMTAWLQSNLDKATEDFALGPELFQQMLWDTERVDSTVEELEAIGRADLERNQQALRLACAEFAPGEDVRDCFALMSARKSADGPVISARDQMRETKAFLVEQDLVSIPGDEEARVAEAPPYARSNSAYITIPGPFENNQPSTYYISPPNPEWPEEVQAAYIPGEADLMFTSIHEVWPGHFLNFLHANRAPWFFGRLYVGYAFAEGWAHYTEEMMIEAGLRDGDPETRIGQISNALLRDARFLSTIGLHTQGWSVEDSKQFFMEEGFQGEGTAIQQAARGTYDPAYLNYTLGKLMIKRLREDWTSEHGGREAWREFHDAFLSYGGPPVPLVRQQMMGEVKPRALFPKALCTGNEEPAAVGPVQTTWAYRCADGTDIVTDLKGASLWMFLPSRTLELVHVRDGSGAKYEAEGVSFLEKGGDALLTTDAGTTTCTVDRYTSVWEDAKLRGVDFRATGNEPGWHLELTGGGHSLLVTNYGQNSLEFTATQHQDLETGTGSVFSAQEEDINLAITLTPGPCQDSMSDHSYETKVEVRWGEDSWHGCGRALH
jgi:uncharacterized protein (DUF885 family)/uncharacterized membrane protein